MVLLSTLLLGTVLTGPAAQEARNAGITDPFAATAHGPSAAGSDLRDPFEVKPAAVATAPGPERRAKRRAPSADLRDPFAPASEGEAAARRNVARPTSLDLAGPFAGPSAGESAAKRVVPLATTRPDLRDPFAP